MRSPFGSVLAGAGGATLSTADGVQVRLKGGFVEKAALRIFGIPHMGMRVRASCVSSMIGDVQGKDVLDAGCGPGLHMLLLSARGGHIVGVDADRKKVKSGVDIAKNLGREGQHSLPADVTKLPFRDASFHVLLCSDVLEHIGDDGSALSEFFRVLSDGGRLVITVPTPRLGGAFHRTFGHVRPGYYFEGLERKLDASGFRVARWEYYLKPFGSVSWKLNRFMFGSRVLAALSFYPLYAFSKLDMLLPRGTAGDGLAVLAVKKAS
jgi:SAM-dependent methyltransferase